MVIIVDLIIVICRVYSGIYKNPENIGRSHHFVNVTYYLKRDTIWVR